MKTSVINNWTPSSDSNQIYVSDKVDFDGSFYRYMDVEKAYNFITKGELVLSNPSEWFDPYESRFFDADYTELAFIKPSVYCSCFTQKATNEAAWVMYSHYKKGLSSRCVKLKIDIKRLLGIFYIWIKDNPNTQLFLGNVFYGYTENNINSVHQKTSRFHSHIFRNYNEFKFADLLLVKRKAFEYEAESRILIFTDYPQQKSLKLVVPKDLIVDLIEKIVIDPNCTDIEFSILKKEFQSHLGVNIKITKSRLYTKRDTIKIDKV